MTVSCARYRCRSGPLAGAALAVLLTVLAHVIACSYGHAMNGAQRTATPVAASAPSPMHPLERSLQLTQSGGDSHGHPACTDADTLTLQPTRGTLAAPEALQQPVRLLADAPSAPALAAGGDASGRRCDASPPERSRAQLGVWRT
ncbi:hypothetical protein [Streptomyces longwoodensis]|uniref:hypothetical protein n=1 Tax=Streptomyces longwoodensis TaxID=68231 RepID=UPI0033F28516